MRALVLIVALFTTACTEPCVRNSDCPRGLVCQAANCVTPPNPDADDSGFMDATSDVQASDAMSDAGMNDATIDSSDDAMSDDATVDDAMSDDATVDDAMSDDATVDDAMVDGGATVDDAMVDGGASDAMSEDSGDAMASDAMGDTDA